MGKNSSNFNSSKFLHRWKTMEESFILEQVLDKFEEARRGERSKKERFCSLLHGRRCNFSDKGITFVEISVDEIKHFWLRSDIILQSSLRSPSKNIHLLTPPQTKLTIQLHLPSNNTLNKRSKISLPFSFSVSKKKFPRVSREERINCDFFSLSSSRKMMENFFVPSLFDKRERHSLSRIKKEGSCVKRLKYQEKTTCVQKSDESETFILPRIECDSDKKLLPFSPFFVPIPIFRCNTIFKNPFCSNIIYHFLFPFNSMN